MTFYHATTRDRIASIQRLGLGGDPNAERNFEFSEQGVYLAENPVLALGFLLERAMAGAFRNHSPQDYVAAFAVIVIDASRVDPGRLRADENIGQEGFWIYSGVIDVTSMPVIGADEVMCKNLAS
jgi:hypothetical protein